MDLLIVFLVSVIIFAIQLKLCRMDLEFPMKMIPAAILALAALVISVVYVVQYWGYSSEENTTLLFTMTLVVIYFGVADGIAWLINYVINRRKEN